MKALFEIAMTIVVLFAIFIVGVGLGSRASRDNMEKQAVRAGVAHYVFDDAGDPHFEWRKP